MQWFYHFTTTTLDIKYLNAIKFTKYLNSGVNNSPAVRGGAEEREAPYAILFLIGDRRQNSKLNMHI